MTLQADLESRIAREHRRVTELRNEIMRREAFIQGLEAALGLLTGRGSSDGSEELGESLRSGSDVSKAQQLLSETKRPLHIGEILTGIGREDTKANRASLSSSLARYARKGEIFQRGPRPNEFMVITASTTVDPAVSEDVEEEAVQLPDLFGTV